MSWTPEREAKLKELWKKGYSGSEIAKMIGDVTRNAIIGKAHRLKLEARSVSTKTTTKVNTEKESSNEIKSSKLSRKAKFKALLLDKNFEAENPTKIEDLTNDHCRWPLGEKMEPAKLFCGRKSIEKFPYCKLHLLYAFQPKNAKEEDQITEDDVPPFIEKKIKSA
jgi:GcrA cell cycle regulator